MDSEAIDIDYRDQMPTSSQSRNAHSLYYAGLASRKNKLFRVKMEQIIIIIVISRTYRNYVLESTE